MFTSPKTATSVLASITILLTVVTGCGDDPAPRSADPTSSASASPTTDPPSDPAESSGQYDTEFDVARPTITSAAVREFGTDEAAAGTEEALAFSQAAFYDDHCVTTPAGEEVDRCALALGESMTPKAQTNWEQSVKEFVKDAKNDEYGSSQGSADVLSVCFYGAMAKTHTDSQGRELSINPEGPVMVKKKISTVTTGVSTDDRLAVKVKSSADMRLLINGKPSVWHLSRDITYWMVKTDDGWKIDAWNGIWHSGSKTPEKQP